MNPQQRRTVKKKIAVRIIFSYNSLNLITVNILFFKTSCLMLYSEVILAIVAIISVEVSRRKSKATNYCQVEKKMLERILSPDIHDSQIKPLGSALNQSDSDESTKVLLNLFVHRFEKTDDVNMEFRIQITF